MDFVMRPCYNLGMSRTRVKSSLPSPPVRYNPEDPADDPRAFYREGDVVTFISSRETFADRRGVELRSGVIVFRPGRLMAREVYIMDTTETPKKGEEPRYWRLPYVRLHSVRRNQVLIAKSSVFKGDL